MKLSEINNIINSVISEEIRNTILMESNHKEVYHIKSEGEPIATFDTEKEALEALPDYKAKSTGELIIEKGTYESHEDMLDKLDEMGEELEEKENKNMENQEPIDEKLVGKQKNIDKNDNGKIDAEDFKLLNKEEEDCNECGEMNEQDSEGQDVDSIWEKYNDAAFEYHSDTLFSDEYEFASNIISHIVQDAIDNGDIDVEDSDDLENDIKEVYGEDIIERYEDNDMEDEDMEDEDMEDDDMDMDMNESSEMCEQCGGEMKEGVCNECSSGMKYESNKKVLRLKESEMVELINRIVTESIPGLEVTKRAQTQSKKDNESNATEVAKKIKGATTFDGNDNPEFPKQIGKGEKVARKNTPEQEEEIEDNRGGGLEDLSYDMEPSQQFKDRVKKSLEGHSSTGNSQDYGNVIKSDLGKKIADKVERKQKARKDMVMYNKDVQPTKSINESINYDNLEKHSDKDLESLIDTKKKEREKLNLKKDKLPVVRGHIKELGAQISKIEKELNGRKTQLKKESVVESKSILEEEIQKMKKMLSYNEKTQ